jgi:segregation and condensation protein A
MNDLLPPETPDQPGADNEPPETAGIDESHFRGHRVQIGEFDGPLDLLLHLVRVNEVEIADIPIVEITRQYNDYLDLLRELNLEVAGEYLVMAATLMHIKSRMLLPVEELGDDEEGDDPRSELAQQLLEYQRFKQAAESLQAMDSRRGLIWTRDGIPTEFEGEELLAVDMFDLLTAFRGLLHRLGEEARLRLKRDNVSVADKIEWLSGVLERRRSLTLVELLTDLPSKLERIAVFLAVLEMMRLQQIVAFQRKLFGEIRIALRADSADAAPSEPPAEGDGGEPGTTPTPEGGSA